MQPKNWVDKPADLELAERGLNCGGCGMKHTASIIDVAVSIDITVYHSLSW